MAALVLEELAESGAEFGWQPSVGNERGEEGLGDLLLEEGGLLVHVDAEKLIVAEALRRGEGCVGGGELERGDAGRGAVGGCRGGFGLEC